MQARHLDTQPWQPPARRDLWSMCLLCVFASVCKTFKVWKLSFPRLLYTFRPPGCPCQQWSKSGAGLYPCHYRDVFRNRRTQGSHDSICLQLIYGGKGAGGYLTHSCKPGRGGQRSWEAAPPDICPWESSLIWALLKQQVGGPQRSSWVFSFSILLASQSVLNPGELQCVCVWERDRENVSVWMARNSLLFTHSILWLILHPLLSKHRLRYVITSVD